MHSPKTREYEVRIPVTGYVTVYVEAKDQDEALDIALGEDLDINEADGVQFHTSVMHGGHYLGALDEVEVIEVK